MRAAKHCVYDSAYHHKLRGFLYGLQKGSVAFNRHDFQGYRFYAFSNIFPAKTMHQGDRRTLIVSCPNKDFIYYLRGRISELQELQKPIEIGEMQFTIESVTSFTKHLGTNVRLITGTPIVMRIPKETYSKYGIQSNRPFEYWRPEHDFQAFVNQLTDNLMKKYASYYGKTAKGGSLFEEFKFVKSVAVPRTEENRKVPTIGSVWEFGFSHLSVEQRQILELGLDAGFGELNSSGFGFMNVVET